MLSDSLASWNVVDSTPTIAANAPTPTSQPIRPPRSSRSAWAVGEASSPSRGARRSRDSISPLPTSRRSVIAPASANSAAPTASGSRSTSGRGSANGRDASAQPSGVVQRTQPAPEEVSATTRSRNASASATMPSSSASRRVGATWLATAPTPANTSAGEIAARAR